MTNTLPLPFPYVPGALPATDKEFQDRVQQNFDALAIAVGELTGGLSIAVTQPARTLGTIYQPNTLRPVVVAVSILVGGGGVTAGVEVLIGSATPPTTRVGYIQSDPAANDYRMGTFVVPANWYYKVAAANGSPTLDKLTEWRL